MMRRIVALLGEAIRRYFVAGGSLAISRGWRLASSRASSRENPSMGVLFSQLRGLNMEATGLAQNYDQSSRRTTDRECGGESRTKT